MALSALRMVTINKLFSETLFAFKKNMISVFYSTGIFYGVSVFGAAVGYLLSGVFLNIYGDFYREDKYVYLVHVHSYLTYGLHRN